MRVVSKLVELEFHVDRIQSAKNGIVILNDPTKSMATKVFIDPTDAMAIAKVVLSSGAAWRFMLTFSFSYLRNKYRKPQKKSAGVKP
ncbi:hypothetical protein [Govanella unica]|uniref:Uncharacterized protein n=1 Tax=Govanella unica TaxID=2975056 RepID=A0A9X3TY98_9PROT|nr:hypothetical protein [Govania unica]MDA5193868.1 hypothetical protein [Govania unica]